MQAVAGQLRGWDERVYQAYARTFDDERHINNLQNTLRGFASAWLLATFGAIGYVMLCKKDDIWIFPPHLVLALLPVMGGAGISVLCVLDQIVYRRLLSGVILTGLQMEFFNPFLPPARATGMLMGKVANDIGQVQGFRWFYQVPLVGLLLMAVVASLLLLFDLPSPSDCPTPFALFMIAGLTTLMTPLLGFRYLRRRLLAYNPKDNHKLIRNKELRQLLDNEAFHKIVNRYELAQVAEANGTRDAVTPLRTCPEAENTHCH